MIEALAAYLKKQGAGVELNLHNSEHEVRRQDISAISPFLFRERDLTKCDSMRASKQQRICERSQANKQIKVSNLS
jgi:hypothetical protein